MNYRQTQQNLNVDDLFFKIGDLTSQSTQDLDSIAKNLDPSNPADLVNFQYAMNRWTVLAELQSSIIKNIKDVLRGIVQKT